MADELRDQIVRLGLDAAVLMGERHDVNTILGVTDVYVRPGLAEGFAGITVLEAQAMGLPVVAFETEDVGLAIKHGETGWLVPTGDVAELARVIGQLLDDPKQARRLGEAGQRFVDEHFAISAIVNGLESLYQNEILKQLPRRTLAAPRQRKSNLD
jgi:glycosyltransferase involved in cell wall biosynthesis